MGQNPVPPVNIRVSLKIGSKMGGAPTPKWDTKTVLTIYIYICIARLAGRPHLYEPALWKRCVLGPAPPRCGAPAACSGARAESAGPATGKPRSAWSSGGYLVDVGSGEQFSNLSSSVVGFQPNHNKQKWEKCFPTTTTVGWGALGGVGGVGGGVGGVG